MPADIAWRRTAETRLGARLHPFEHVVASYNAVLVSGSSKTETSADANIDGRYNGALTYYLLQTLSAPNGLTQTAEEAVARTRCLASEWLHPAPTARRFSGLDATTLPRKPAEEGCFIEQGCTALTCFAWGGPTIGRTFSLAGQVFTKLPIVF
jgi:hypothetical protein